MKQTAALLLVMGLLSVAFGTSKAYDVVPYGNCVAEIVTAPNNGVMQFYRNTLDSITKVSVWIGDTIDTSSFNIDVVDSAMPTHVLAYRHGVKASQCWAWLNVDLEPDQVNKPIRGRTYRVWVTRNNHPISFAYDPRNPYGYGHISVHGANPQPDTLASDLALRVIGLHDTITPDWWAICPACPWNHPEQLGTWRAIMETLGVKRADFSIYWNAIEKTRGTFNFDDSSYRHDTVAAWLHGRVGCVLDARPQQCPAWASSRFEIDSIGNTVMSPYCPPLNLFRPALDSSNYWGRFIGQTIQHYDALGDTIHIWTGLNEPNDTTTDTATLKWNTGWWRRPNVSGAYDSLGPGARPLCSLYVRLCQVTESVIHHGGFAEHSGDTILIGSTSRVRDTDRVGIVFGDSWIRMCYDIGTAHGTRAPFWTGVAVHPYQGWQPQTPSSTQITTSSMPRECIN